MENYAFRPDVSYEKENLFPQVSLTQVISPCPRYKVKEIIPSADTNDDKKKVLKVFFVKVSLVETA